jgi:tRNA pseudouridine38-40 synthase
MKLRLTIAYDGQPYAGWQSQASGNAVQDILERAFASIAGARVTVYASGRTDAGVHALGQSAHVEVRDGMSAGEWQRALNAKLPATIRIMNSRWAAADFHARFSARGKVYRYLIRDGPILPPHEFGRVWHIAQPLDVVALGRAGVMFTGRHDFAAFCSNRGDRDRDTIRTMRTISISRRAGLIALTFEGDGFLYKMVRMLTAGLVRVAQRREDLGNLRARLKEGAPKWNHVAPAEGLYLIKVHY